MCISQLDSYSVIFMMQLFFFSTGALLIDPLLPHVDFFGVVIIGLFVIFGIMVAYLKSIEVMFLALLLQGTLETIANIGKNIYTLSPSWSSVLFLPIWNILVHLFAGLLLGLRFKAVLRPARKVSSKANETKPSDLTIYKLRVTLLHILETQQLFALVCAWTSPF